MEGIQVELDSDVVALLKGRQTPLRESVRELIVLELYRQGELSGGRAAEMLGLSRDAFIRHAASQGIPYFQLEGDDVRRELEADEH
jgi:predicted HTH domain antitoxin